MLDDPMRPLAGKEMEVTRAGDNVVVHDVAHAKIHVLNETGGAILELCDGARSPSEIAEIISRRYAAPLEQVRRDVEAALHAFVILDLVR